MDLLDVDTEQYVTFRQAERITGRTKKTLQRWVREGRVEKKRFASGIEGLNERQLLEVERATRRQLAENRKVV